MPVGVITRVTADLAIKYFNQVISNENFNDIEYITIIIIATVSDTLLLILNIRIILFFQLI